MALNLNIVILVLLLILLCNYCKAIPCEDARLKCAYREGCGMALHNYLIGCTSLELKSDFCPEQCQHALIALTSTNEGKELMMCECGDNMCRDRKARVEVCRPQVVRATRAETVVTCEVAQWICSADTLCSTALKYYNVNCRSMFAGRKCSPRCKNSIDILRRQEKAAKLDSCVCNGREDYDCNTIRTNMESLCFNKHKNNPFSTSTSITSNPIETNELEIKTINSGFIQTPLHIVQLLIYVTINFIRTMSITERMVRVFVFYTRLLVFSGDLSWLVDVRIYRSVLEMPERSGFSGLQTINTAQ